MAQTLRLLREKRYANVAVRVYARADHTLRVPPATAGGRPRNAPGFPAAIARFARSPGRARD